MWLDDCRQVGLLLYFESCAACDAIRPGCGEANDNGLSPRVAPLHFIARTGEHLTGFYVMRYRHNVYRTFCV